jgi:hypothetical protein
MANGWNSAVEQARPPQFEGGSPGNTRLVLNARVFDRAVLMISMWGTEQTAASRRL